MKARDLMTANPFTVTPADPVWRAAEIMKYEDIGAVPVVSDSKTLHLEGLITDRDISTRCVARKHGTGCLIGSHMTPRPLRTVLPDADVDEIIAKMEASQVRRIPVVDEEGMLIGIVAERDLAQKLNKSSALAVRKHIKASTAPAMATVDAMIATDRPWGGVD